MLKKTILLLVSLLITGVLGFEAFRNYSETVKDKHCFVTQISSRIFDFNRFILKVDPSLHLNDFKVINKNSGKIIFKNGVNLKGIDNDYGYCVFELFYLNKKIYEIGHFKYNNWETNKYELEIFKVSNVIKPNLKIISSADKKCEVYYRVFPN